MIEHWLPLRMNLAVAALAAAALAMCGCPGKSGGDGKQSKPGAGSAGDVTAPGDRAATAPGGTSAAYAPDDPRLVEENNRGVALMGRSEYAKARDVFAGLSQRHPEWLDVRVNEAIATLNRQEDGDEERALRMLAEVLERDPEHLRARYSTGLLKRYLGDSDTALPHFQAVAAADPADAYAAYYVGQCLEEVGRMEESLLWYRKAISNDGYLRSAYYRTFQVAARLGRTAEAEEHEKIFTRLMGNPRGKLVEMIYSRMGPKSEVVTVNVAKPQPAPLPAGPLFADAAPLPISNGETATWRAFDGSRTPSITACDIDGDGAIDLFIAGAIETAGSGNNAVLLNRAGQFELQPDHPLAAVADVNAALWGDFDNDNLTDVYLCRRGPNQLWRQAAANQWQDVTDATRTSNGALDTVDGLMFDADHDGDLDIFCVNADGPNELLNNNLDGRFRPIAAERGLAGDGRGSRQVLAADLDHDRDLDIIVIHQQPPHEVFINDRMWEYRKGDGFEGFANMQATAVTAADSDADGQCELYSIGPEGSLLIWRPDEQGKWQSLRPPPPAVTKGAPARAHVAVLDLAGSGAMNAICDADDGFIALEFDFRTDHSDRAFHGVRSALAGWAPVVLDPNRGAAIVGIPLVTAGLKGSAPVIWQPGPGRHPFISLVLTGQEQPDGNPPARSNRSGIGAHLKVRIDSQWTAVDTLRAGSGPGQSLQPIAVGLAGHDKLDFIMIDWSDGVFQSEMHGTAEKEGDRPRDLTAGHVELIPEIQRQKSSCPVLFAWNGRRFQFVSDLLGVGGLGYMTAPGEYAPPRPWENFLLPEGLLQPRGGRYILKLSEPMEEVCYLDSVELKVYDLPPGWKMALDERMSIAGPEPTGEPRFYRREVLPVGAVNDRAEDVTRAITSADQRAAPVGQLDSRFIGRLKGEHVITLTFDGALDGAEEGSEGSQGQTSEPSSDAPPMLVADGWVEYPYSQTMFAAWQAGAEYRAPTIEARGADGEWRVVLEQFGYPAGMPRQMSVPLAGLPRGTTQLRIRTNQEIMWDRLAIAYPESCAEARVWPLTLASAHLAQTGYAERSTGPQRLPHYNYDRRRGLYDSRYLTGLYTHVGPVNDLVAAADGALAIFGPGEEIHMEFAGHQPDATALEGPSLSEPETGWSRRFVFESRGWCKDMDLYTKDGETVEPLPVTPASDGVNRMHIQRNSRFSGGW